MALNGIQISTNISAVSLEFDKLIQHINTTIRQPFNLNLNINQIQQQLSQVTKETEQFKSALNSAMGGTVNSGGLDKMITTTRTLKGEMADIAKEVTTVTSNMGQTIQVTEKFGKVIEGNMVTEQKIGATVTKTTENYKAQSAEVNKIAMAKEKVSATNENNKLTETTKLLQQEYSLQNQIIVAQDKGLVGKAEELKLQEQINSASLGTAKNGLSGESKATLLNVENELIDKQRIKVSGVNDTENIGITKLEQQISLYQQRMIPQVDALLIKMKQMGVVDTSGLEKYKLELESISASSFNKGQMTQNFNNLKSSANENIATMKNLNTETKGFLSTMGSSAGKFAQFALVGGLLMGVVSALKQGLVAVTDLDNGMNALRIDMMGANEDAFTSLAKGSQNLSIQIGTNIKDITDIMAVYSNANSTAQQIIEKTRPSAILANISGMTGRDSSDAIQSVLLVFNEFKNSSDSIAVQSTKVSDTFASVASKLNLDFKTGLTSMAAAVKVSGAVINEAGMNLSSYSAIVGNLAEKTRLSGETIGASIKFVDLVA